MNLFRKFLVVVLGGCMIFTVSAPAFAAELEAGPKSEPCDIVLPYNPAQADSMVNGDTRDASIPSKFYNLDGQNYYVNGTFRTTIYTSYYFYPNANGEFWYNMTFTWVEPRATQGQATVQCWDKTTKKMVLEQKFDMPYNAAEDIYGPTIESGPWHLYNLDPTHQYYFCFTKTFDDVWANVIGTISTTGWVY